MELPRQQLVEGEDTQRRDIRPVLPSPSILVSTEARLSQTPDGAIWVGQGIAPDTWARHYASFARIELLARVGHSSSPPPRSTRLEGNAIRVTQLPEYRSVLGAIIHAHRLVLRIHRALGRHDVALAVLPGIVGFALAVVALGERRRLAIDVVGDPDAVFGEAAAGGRLRGLYRVVSVTGLRWACRHAAAINYVTSRYLQQKYPPGRTTIVANYSVFNLTSLSAAERRTDHDGPHAIVTVGSLEQPYKGVDDLLRACAILASSFDVRLVVVGDGRLRPQMEQLAEQLGIRDRCRFTGWLSPAGVGEQLGQADLFVLASHTEGLPRALIEAMHVGLPCVASAVGGVPELLSPDTLVPARDHKSLARVIARLLAQPTEAARLGQMNQIRAQEFLPEEQAKRREAFLKAVAAPSRKVGD